ncbi:hypothetical protein [Massilia cavernae]|uniref:hypothetical protein n=1 Tax=Massilia cavernae TaxID=2320864 RepID=UPI0011C394FC|nr:hypothetical protein [Massilia cavernae]
MHLKALREVPCASISVRSARAKIVGGLADFLRRPSRAAARIASAFFGVQRALFDRSMLAWAALSSAHISASMERCARAMMRLRSSREPLGFFHNIARIARSESCAPIAARIFRGDRRDASSAFQ